MLRARALALLAVVVCGPSCGPSFDDEEESDYDDPGLGELGKADVGGGTVEDAVRETGCSTTPVLPLARQIADEMVCMDPGALIRFEEGAGLRFSGSAILPYLSPQAYQDLQRASAAGDVQVMSGFRTLPQQYLLRRWFVDGRCGITAAATPGRSNHESGRAIDARNWSAAQAPLLASGWSEGAPGDPAHFDHLDSGDLRGLDVLAFQRLWNRNRADGDGVLAEDGVYGPGTEDRLRRSPAGGFAQGPCSVGTAGAVVSVDNASTTKFGHSAGWWADWRAPGFAGEDYLAIEAGLKAWAAWYLDPPGGHAYEIFVHVPPHPMHSSRARYRVRTSGDAEPAIFEVDQRTGGKVSLGVFPLSTSAWVSVDTEGADGITVADLVTAEPRD